MKKSVAIKFLAFMLCLTMLGALAAALAEEEKPLVVGVPIYTMEHPYYIDLVKNIEIECAAQGVQLIKDDSNYDSVKQVSIIENMIIQGVDVLIVAAIDPEGIVPTLEMAIEKGVKIILEANPVEDSSGKQIGETFVGVDNYAAALMGGEASGKAYAERFGDTPAKIAIISYPLEQACIDRENGFIDGFKKFVPDAEVVTSQNGEAVRDKSMSIMENILTANPDINVVFGINDDSALGALAAMEARGINENAMVVGFDGTDDAKAAILAGGIYFGDVVQDSAIIGQECVRAAVAAGRGEKLPEITEIAASFITIEDLK